MGRSVGNGDSTIEQASVCTLERVRNDKLEEMALTMLLQCCSVRDCQTEKFHLRVCKAFSSFFERVRYFSIWCCAGSCEEELDVKHVKNQTLAIRLLLSVSTTSECCCSLIHSPLFQQGSALFRLITPDLRRELPEARATMIGIVWNLAVTHEGKLCRQVVDLFLDQLLKLCTAVVEGNCQLDRVTLERLLTAFFHLSKQPSAQHHPDWHVVERLKTLSSCRDS